MISFHTNHRLLLVVPLALFLGLTVLIAIAPAVEMNAGIRAGAEKVSPSAARGRALYVSEGCSYCHTQQVRSDTRRPPGPDGRLPALAQDARWGTPSRPGDYAGDNPPLLGTERTGPDLHNVGDRLPSVDWHLTHLYDPRILVPDSPMPAYRWYFRGKADRRPEDRRVLLTDAARERLGPGVEVWAGPQAQDLVEYLLSLRHGGKP